jgi:hypothetical protein
MLLLNSIEGENLIEGSMTWQKQESKSNKKIIPEIYKSLNHSFNVTRNDIRKIIRTRHKSLRERWKKIIQELIMI